MSYLTQEKWPWIEGSHKTRLELLDTLNDADLAFNPGGHNMTLGALCREMGEVEYSYLQSLKTFKQDWSYRNAQPGLELSTAQLKQWYIQLDEEMRVVVASFSDEDAKKTIDRGGYPTPVDLQLDIYLQALLIFFGKATIFLRAMERPLPGDMLEWIG